MPWLSSQVIRSVSVVDPGSRSTVAPSWDAAAAVEAGGTKTHAAVAAFVASGMADIAFGIEPAARQFKLDFVPIIQERYMLACHKDSLRLAPVRELIELLGQPAFREVIRQVPGYQPDEPGTVAMVPEIFPWARA